MLAPMMALLIAGFLKVFTLPWAVFRDSVASQKGSAERPNGVALERYRRISSEDISDEIHACLIDGNRRLERRSRRSFRKSK